MTFSPQPETGARRPRRRGIGFKIAMVALLVTAATVGAIVTFGHLDRLSKMQSLEANANSVVTELLAAQMAGGLRWGKAEVVEAVFTQVAAREDSSLAGAVAYDGEGKPLAEYGSKTLPAYDVRAAMAKHGPALQKGEAVAFFDGDHFVNLTPVVTGKNRERVGTLAVAWSEHRLRDDANRSLLMNAAIFVLGVGALVGALIFAMGRVVTGPVDRLVSAMRRLSEGDLAVEVPRVAANDEIGDMALALDVFKRNAVERVELARQAEEAREREERLQQEQEERARIEAAERARRDAEAREAEIQRRREAEEADRLRADEQRRHEERQRQAAEEKRRAEMIELAAQFESAVGGVVEAVAEASSRMTMLAQDMSQAIEQTDVRATNVAGAAEEASANVQTVASAAEELSASLREIARSVSRSTEISTEAVRQAETTNAQVNQLADAARKIGEIVSVIQGIAGQTNLLALNATIEAARAGEAGKGFAVVASEVKNLATQTAKATEEVGTQIAAIQSQVGEAVDAIRAIGGTIGEVNAIASEINASVDQQTAATRDIASNVAEASAGTRLVSENIAAVSSVARETGVSAAEVLKAAGDLSSQADMLRQSVTAFIARVRAA